MEGGHMQPPCVFMASLIPWHNTTSDISLGALLLHRGRAQVTTKLAAKRPIAGSGAAKWARPRSRTHGRAIDILKLVFEGHCEGGLSR